MHIAQVAVAVAFGTIGCISSLAINATMQLNDLLVIGHEASWDLLESLIIASELLVLRCGVV